MVQFLLDNGANISVKNRHGNNAIMIACVNQRLEILRLLLNPHQRSKHTPTSRQYNLLDVQLQAYMGGNEHERKSGALEEQEIELNRRSHIKDVINEKNIKDMTSVHAACLSGNVPIVKHLLDHGADLNRRDHVSTQGSLSHFCLFIALLGKIHASSLRDRQRQHRGS